MVVSPCSDVSLSEIKIGTGWMEQVNMLKYDEGYSISESHLHIYSFLF